MRLQAIVCGVASILLAAAPAAAQQTSEVPNPQSPPPPPVPSPAAQWREQALPLLADLLEQQASLGLSPAQVEGIEHLADDFAREVIRRQADRQIATLDLATMLEPDPADPAKPLDLSRVESKIREIERIDADLEVARLRTIEAGKAQLSAEQRAKLGGLLAGDDPAEAVGVSRAAAHPGRGGAPGHPGGGRPGHPSGGGVPGHPQGWHGWPPGRGPGFHPGIHGRVFIGAWPWYGWGYPGPVYTAPPPPSYWYYCPAYGAYYPDVPSCPEPWIPVPAG
jgi:hypothetical protein